MKGTYTAGSGVEDLEHCGPCDAGQYCHSPGLTAPQGPCEAGFYCTGGSHTASPVTTSTLISRNPSKPNNPSLIHLFLYRLALGMVTFVLQVTIVHRAPDTHMSSLVLLVLGVTHLGLRARHPVGFALLVSSATALASFSQQEYVLQVWIRIISNPYRILLIFTPDRS